MARNVVYNISRGKCLVFIVNEICAFVWIFSVSFQHTMVSIAVIARNGLGYRHYTLVLYSGNVALKSKPITTAVLHAKQNLAGA